MSNTTKIETLKSQIEILKSEESILDEILGGERRNLIDIFNKRLETIFQGFNIGYNHSSNQYWIHLRDKQETIWFELSKINVDHDKFEWGEKKRKLEVTIRNSDLSFNSTKSSYEDYFYMMEYVNRFIKTFIENKEELNELFKVYMNVDTSKLDAIQSSIRSLERDLKATERVIAISRMDTGIFVVLMVI